MTEQRLLFVSGNVEKLEDVRAIVGSWTDIRVDHYPFAVKELQTSSIQDLIEDKVMRAFARARYPLVVDHTCLSLAALNGLPGTQASSFWEYMRDDICKIIATLGNSRAEVSVALGYTDGRTIKHFVTTKKGSIAPQPRGTRRFDWDRIFIPSGDTKTYAEMTPSEKNKTSPRAVAFTRLARELRKNGSIK